MCFVCARGTPGERPPICSDWCVSLALVGFCLEDAGERSARLVEDASERGRRLAEEPEKLREQCLTARKIGELGNTSSVEERPIEDHLL